MNAQDFQKAMADVMRRQQQGLPPITTAGQIDAEINKPMSSGMMSAYVDTAQAPPPQPSGSVDGRQASADKQRGIAKSLRGGAAPKGMTAGPYNVYYGPNVGESIGEAGKHLMAGYVDMKANEKDAEADALRSLERATALEKADAETARVAAIEARKLKLLENADKRADKDPEKDKDYEEFSNGVNTIRGYVEDGIGYTKDGKLLPDGYTKHHQPTGTSSIPFQAITKQDAWGNIVVTSYDKSNDSMGEPRFIDGTPYTPEEGEKRGGTQAKQAGDMEKAKKTAQTLVEQYGESGEALMASNAAIGQYKIAKQSLKEGANTGWIDQFIPTIKAPSIKMRNARDSQALTQIAAYTFGSLSEAEGDWLKDTSIPLDMEEEELDMWLDKRIQGFERASASERYRLDEIKAGRQPNPKVIEIIKYGDGFSWD